MKYATPPSADDLLVECVWFKIELNFGRIAKLAVAAGAKQELSSKVISSCMAFKSIKRSESKHILMLQNSMENDCCTLSCITNKSQANLNPCEMEIYSRCIQERN